ncbi:hypothetical protein AOLI_G00292950 [Acnodon oligacanthus]
MELSFVFFVLGLTVNAQTEDFQDYQSLRSKSTTYPAALPSADQNNTGYNTRKASTEGLPRLTVALIASPGTDLFHVLDERHRSTTVKAMTATAEEVISLRDERFVSNHGSGLFTSGEDNTSAIPLASGTHQPLISDEKEGESVVTSAQAGAGLVMSGTMTAAAHLSRGREKIAASLHAPLNSKNQRAAESITLLPAKSIPMLSASDPAVIDNLGEATETVERQRKSINENGPLKSLGTTNPLNATESIFTDPEKTFVQNGSPTIIHLTAVQNRTQLDTEGSAAGVETVAQKHGDGQSGQNNMPNLSSVTRRSAIFDVDTPLPLGLSSKEVVKETAESTKSLTTKGHASIMSVYTDAMDEKLHVSKVTQPSEVPFPKTGKLHVTRSSVTSPSTHTLLQRIVSAGDESEGELASASAADSQVGSTIHSPSQTVQSSQSSALVKAAIESFLSTQPLASPATAETPKMVEQMINQASSLNSTLSSIIAAVSNGKDINGPLLPYQTASAGDDLQQAASSQAPSTRQAMKRHTVNISAVKHLTLNPATSPPPKTTTDSVKSTLQPGGPNKLFTIRSLPLTPVENLTGSLTMLRSHPHVKENVLKGRSTQTTLPSITEGMFFAIGHTDVSMAGSEITATKSPQASSLQLSEESESDLSTVFPFESNLAKSTELMSDLPVMQRRMRIASPDFLSGLAQISDDICGSGNYTAEMRLTLERDIMPGDLVPALGNLHVVINLKTNNTQVNLEIKSCCLSPTVRLDEFNTTCCLFSRLPIDPQGIHLLPTVLSKRASFTISLFQMINYSTAYLHCDLSVCLRNNSECEQCQQHRNAHAADNGEVLFSNTGNRISFGPVLKETDDSALIETAGVDSAEAAVILGSISGCFLVCIALMLLWTIYRHRLQRSGHCQCWTPHGCSRNGEHFLP